MNHKLKIGIVEDEAIIAQNIYELLKSLGYDAMEPASDYKEGIQLLKEGKPDLLILDIRLGKGPDGIELGKYIKENYGIPFIFLTANADSDTINSAKLAAPSAYLVKPFNRNDLFSAIEIASHNHQSSGKNRERRFILLKDGNAMKKLSLEDIVYAESEHVYVRIYTKHRHYLHRRSLQQLLLDLDDPGFLQTHRCFLVNMQHVIEILADHLNTEQYKIPVSRNHRKLVRNYFINNKGKDFTKT